MSVLDVRNLKVFFSANDRLVEAVRGIDFSVEAGERVAIVGESGSGKSVTARAIMGLLGPNAEASGSIVLDGFQMVNPTAKTLHAVRGGVAGMVFQNPEESLNPVYTIGDEFALALGAHGKNRKEAQRLALSYLNRVEIPEPEVALTKYPQEFSGGQLQRIVIALALAGKPRLIIADEPTTALDATVQTEILDLLRRECAESGAALLMISHNMAVVADIAQRVVVMRHGKVEESGDVRQVFENPRAAYTKELISAVPRLVKEEEETQPSDARNVNKVVDVQDLFVRYGGRRSKRPPAVKGVSFDLRKGEIVGLVGESGSGKSTIGRALLGLGGDRQGRIELMGTSLEGASKKQLQSLRGRIGVIFQNPATSFNPQETIGAGVAVPLNIHRPEMAQDEKRALVLSALDDVSLGRDVYDSYPHELSGGQLQRASIARALILSPDILIADEPTSALDVTIQSKVLQLILQLHEEHEFACLFISHDLAVVDSVASRVIVLHDGKIDKEGTSSEILHHPTSKYAKRLLSSMLSPVPGKTRATA